MSLLGLVRRVCSNTLSLEFKNRNLGLIHTSWMSPFCGLKVFPVDWNCFLSFPINKKILLYVFRSSLDVIMSILNPGRLLALPSYFSPESLRMAFPYFSIQWSTRSPKSPRHSSSTSWSFKSELDWCRSHLRQRPRSDHLQFRNENNGKWCCYCIEFHESMYTIFVDCGLFLVPRVQCFKQANFLYDFAEALRRV